MARAVVHAANLGAQVVNISMVSCMKAVRPVDDAALGAAIHWAVAERNVVVVAAAGNTGNECNPQNPPPPANDPGSWSNVVTVASPAWWADDVLSVGSVTNDGVPSTFSLHGPWLGVAAPGETITSVGNYPTGTWSTDCPARMGRWCRSMAHRSRPPTCPVSPPWCARNIPSSTPTRSSTASNPPRTQDPPPPIPPWGGCGRSAGRADLERGRSRAQAAGQQSHRASPATAGPDLAPRRVASWVLGGVAAAAVVIVGAVAALRRKPHS
ncbi:subtilase family protein [Mycobacterium xenopi 4042]|uniref:Subtilase family protein n=1 Tax=Mycobacterium xenopi 4042 TaxID=1299334 RepID=X7YR89_MYCXE|nr:subtilase family protein [Mycobacterium xenopi 4042]